MAESLKNETIIGVILGGGLMSAVFSFILGYFQNRRQAHIDIYGEYRQWALDYKLEAKEAKDRVDSLESRLATLESEKNILAVQLVTTQQDLIKERNEKETLKADLARLANDCNQLRVKFEALEKKNRSKE